MKLYQQIWCNVLDKVPKLLELNETVDLVDIRVTPINNLRYGIKLCTQSGDDVLPCERCLHNRVTDVISHIHLTTQPNGDRMLIKGKICVVCDGTSMHESDEIYQLLLYINI